MTHSNMMLPSLGSRMYACLSGGTRACSSWEETRLTTSVHVDKLIIGLSRGNTLLRDGRRGVGILATPLRPWKRTVNVKEIPGLPFVFFALFFSYPHENQITSFQKKHFKKIKMAANLLSLLVGLGIAYIAVTLIQNQLKRARQPLPPGPRGLPLLGNLNDLPKPGMLEAHHWLEHKKKYGGCYI